jgi:hypothetical protein
VSIVGKRDRIVLRDERGERVAVDVFSTVRFWRSEGLATRLNPRRATQQAHHLHLGHPNLHGTESSGNSRIAVETPCNTHCDQPKQRKHENSSLVSHVGSGEATAHLTRIDSPNWRNIPIALTTRSECNRLITTVTIVPVMKKAYEGWAGDGSVTFTLAENVPDLGSEVCWNQMPSSCTALRQTRLRRRWQFITSASAGSHSSHLASLRSVPTDAALIFAQPPAALFTALPLQGRPNLGQVGALKNLLRLITLEISIRANPR